MLVPQAAALSHILLYFIKHPIDNPSAPLIGLHLSPAVLAHIPQTNGT